MKLCRFRATFLRESDERFLQRHAGPRVVADALHVLHAVLVRFELLIAAVFRLHELSAETGALDHEAGNVLIRAADGRTNRRYGEAGLEESAALLRFRTVAGGGVHDLMAEHSGQLRFTA